VETDFARATEIRKNPIEKNLSGGSFDKKSALEKRTPRGARKFVTFPSRKKNSGSSFDKKSALLRGQHARAWL
jgi:hypothetical protein